MRFKYLFRVYKTLIKFGGFFLNLKNNFFEGFPTLLGSKYFFKYIKLFSNPKRFCLDLKSYYRKIRSFKKNVESLKVFKISFWFFVMFMNFCSNIYLQVFEFFGTYMLFWFYLAFLRSNKYFFRYIKLHSDLFWGFKSSFWENNSFLELKNICEFYKI